MTRSNSGGMVKVKPSGMVYVFPSSSADTANEKEATMSMAVRKMHKIFISLICFLLAVFVKLNLTIYIHCYNRPLVECPVCRGFSLFAPSEEEMLLREKVDVSKHNLDHKRQFHTEGNLLFILLNPSLKHQLILPADREQILDFRLESSK